MEEISRAVESWSLEVIGQEVGWAGAGAAGGAVGVKGHIWGLNESSSDESERKGEVKFWSIGRAAE